MDSIKITNLEIFTRIGCEEKERTTSQRIHLNLDLAVDGKIASKSKELKSSVCYLTLSNFVREYVSSKEWSLVEELAYEVADKCLDKFILLNAVEIEVKKYVVPATESISFTTKRTRLA